MRLGAALALALSGCSAGPPVAPGGIVSTNPCADALLVRLARPERIAALSHYSHQTAASSLPLGLARRFPATAGTAEEVIALRPSLVLTSSFTPPATRAAYAQVGLRTLVLDSPTSVAASEAQVRAVAAALAEPSKGEALVAEIERSVDPGIAHASRISSSLPSPAQAGAQLATAASLGPGLRRGRKSKPIEASTLLFISGDLATGPGTLLDELLTRAGLRDAAADYGLRHTGRIALEALIARPPDFILSPGASRGAMLRRRVLARLGARTAEADFPRRLINCGGPTIPLAMARLAAIRATPR